MFISSSFVTARKTFVCLSDWCNTGMHIDWIHMYHVLSVLCPVWATTAANADESSYACYYDRNRQTYLGDVYSVKWMEDSEKVCICVMMIIV